MENELHYNWLALRDRYLLTKSKKPLITDERYCEIEGLDPSVYAHDKNKLRDYFIAAQEDAEKGKAEYNKLLAFNGLLTDEDTQ